MTPIREGLVGCQARERVRVVVGKRGWVDLGVRVGCGEDGLMERV